MNTIPFEKDAILAYLNRCIEFWEKENQAGDEYAPLYLDAFRAVRKTIFGDALLQVEEKTMSDYCQCENVQVVRTLSDGSLFCGHCDKPVKPATAAMRQALERYRCVLEFYTVQPCEKIEGRCQCENVQVVRVMDDGAIIHDDCEKPVNDDITRFVNRVMDIERFIQSHRTPRFEKEQP